MFWIYFTSPWNSTYWSSVVWETDAGIRNLSAFPLKMVSSVSSGISPTGISISHPFSSKMASISQKMRRERAFPNGASPPSRMLSVGSGMTLSRSMTLTYPSPLHFGQAPCVELKEKLLGAGSRYEMPLTGSIRSLL